jgi:hypothetical protein
MAKNIKIKNPKLIGKKVEEIISLFLTDQKNQDRIEKIIQRDLRAQIRRGIKGDGQSIKDLKAKTIKNRERLEPYNKTNKNFSPSVSNATFTGDLVQKIFAKVKKIEAKSRLKLELGAVDDGPKARHKKYKTEITVTANDGTKTKKIKFIKGSNALISDILRGFKDRGQNLLGIPEKSKLSVKKLFVQFVRRKK